MLSTFLLATTHGQLHSAEERLTPVFGAGSLVQLGSCEAIVFGAEVSTFCNGHNWAIAYGDMDDPADGSVAESLLRQPLEEVHGCFGAALSKDGQVQLVSDGLGSRSLRYVKIRDTWFVSPHDLSLVAAGAPVQLNKSAAASIARIGWSFGNMSLISGVSTVPAEVVITLDGSVEIHPAHARTVDRREGHSDAIIEAMIRYVRDNHRSGTILEVELSAGFDSRAVLATALAAAPTDVETFTDGPAQSQDVRVASKVARTAKVPHRSGRGGTASAEQRRDRFRELAIATNGQATLMPIMTSSATEMDANDSLGGDGLETLRGYYYPKLHRSHFPFEPERFADLLLKRFKVGRGLVAEAEVREMIVARLNSWLTICRSHYDALDLLYLLERTNVWNQKLRRIRSRRFNPLYSHVAVFEFLSLPGPRGKAVNVHQTLYGRFLPSARFIPINGETVPWLLKGKRRRWLSHATTLVMKLAWKLGDRVLGGRAGAAKGDLEEVRRTNFRRHLAEEWHELLTAPRSISSKLLGADALRAVLKRSELGDRQASEVLANMLVAEEFFRQAKSIAERVQNT